ncbi:hypothetical protein [Sulfurimonas indica]|uniref:hypothetical protein n=1 Tax=Sulfurimonas TaxID=202746 RepID=UPI0012642462|nr:hypothetical protein [Sulfurimonas indica]
MKKKKIKKVWVTKAENPYINVIKRNIYKMVENTDSLEIIEKLKELDKVYSAEKAFINMVGRGTMSFQTMIKIMLASGHQKFVFDISDEEKTEIYEFESKKLNS